MSVYRIQEIPRETSELEGDREACVESAGTSGSIHRRISSGSIFGGSSCVVIEHGHQEYRLQITRAGKLILTK